MIAAELLTANRSELDLGTRCTACFALLNPDFHCRSTPPVLKASRNIDLEVKHPSDEVKILD